MTIDVSQLAVYGWSNFFQSQLSTQEWQAAVPARVSAIHRSGLDLIGPDVSIRGARAHFDGNGEDITTVGDWLLLDTGSRQPLRRLERTSLFKRRSPGTGRGIQLLAANVDTLFIVTSCNDDFNIARLERYLAIARQADVTPLVVLTKADLVADATDMVAETRSLSRDLLVETVDSRDQASVAVLQAWCGAGQTVALLGSSGVGKTTLVNTLLGDGDLATAEIREDDAKGRHTTTGRALHRLASGGWVIDTPGMRELQLADAAEGLQDVFADITKLAPSCRFADCGHTSEPGCAVRKAVEADELDPDRLVRYRKLLREEAHNTETVHQRRARGRQFGKMVRGIMAEKRRGEGD